MSNECVNIFIIQMNTLQKELSNSESAQAMVCNDSGVLTLHYGYYTAIMTSRRLFCHKAVSHGTNQPFRNSVYEI